MNAGRTTTLPMATAAILYPAGVLRWMDVHASYGTRTGPPGILAAPGTL
jgi:hypothetical protein